MGDMKDVFKDMKREKRSRHADMHTQNRKIIRDSCIHFLDRDEALLFRGDEKPWVDFYPSTGRWRTPGSSITHRGGAQAFLRWYAKARK